MLSCIFCDFSPKFSWYKACVWVQARREGVALLCERKCLDEKNLDGLLRFDEFDGLFLGWNYDGQGIWTGWNHDVAR